MHLGNDPFDALCVVAGARILIQLFCNGSLLGRIKRGRPIQYNFNEFLDVGHEAVRICHARKCYLRVSILVERRAESLVVVARADNSGRLLGPELGLTRIPLNVDSHFEYVLTLWVFASRYN